MLITREKSKRKKHIRNHKMKPVPSGCWQLPNETCNSTKIYIMTRKTDNRVKSQKTPVQLDMMPSSGQLTNRTKTIKVSQAETHASLVDRRPNDRGENPTDTKKKTRRNTITQTTEVPTLTATLLLNKDDRMLYKPIQFSENENSALLDSGDIQSALFQIELLRIITANPSTFLDELPAPYYKLDIINGNKLPVRKQVPLYVFLAEELAEKIFLSLTTMGNILSGMSIFGKNSVTKKLNNNAVPFPDLSQQFRPKQGGFKCGVFEVETTQKVVAGQFQQVMTITFNKVESSTSITNAIFSVFSKSDLNFTPDFN